MWSQALSPSEQLIVSLVAEAVRTSGSGNQVGVLSRAAYKAWVACMRKVLVSMLRCRVVELSVAELHSEFWLCLVVWAVRWLGQNVWGISHACWCIGYMLLQQCCGMGIAETGDTPAGHMIHSAPMGNRCSAIEHATSVVTNAELFLLMLTLVPWRTCHRGTLGSVLAQRDAMAV